MALGIHEQRRYTSVLVCHDDLRDFLALRKLLAGSVGSHRSVRLPETEWSIHRFEYLANRSLYPGHIVSAEDRRRGDRYAHDVYFATREPLRSLNTPVILLASPYVRLLSSITSDLRKKLDHPAPRYVSVDMASVYQTLSDGSVGELTATKVTMQMLSEPTLELVSLAGRNPLHSELHAAIKKVAAPYSIRTEVSGENSKCRVNIDRHGNFWWFQAEEKRFALPLNVIDRLDETGSLKLTRTRPLDRAEDEDDE